MKHSRIQKETITTNDGDMYTRREMKRQNAEDRGRVRGKAEQGEQAKTPRKLFGVMDKRVGVKKTGQKKTTFNKTKSQRTPRYHARAERRHVKLHA